MKTLESKRLILRDWQLSDLDDLFELLSNPKITIPEGDLPKETTEKCLPVLQYLIQAKNNYALLLKETGRVIGSIGLNEDMNGDENYRNVGFMLAESLWNRGLMTEALEKVIEYASQASINLSIDHSIENTKTQHIINKFGFKYIKTFHNIKRKSDKYPHDDLYYTLDNK